MTSTLDRPVATPSPAPRGPGARALTWIGAVVGGVLLLVGAFSAVDLLLLGSDDATTTTESATFAAAPVVELVADGDVTVTTGGDRVEVRLTSSALLAPAHYSADQLGDRLRVSHRCDWWRPGFCVASLDVTVPDGTAVVVRATDGSVTATSLRGPLEVRVSDGETDVSDIEGDVTVRAADGRTAVSGVRGAVSVSSADGEILVSDVTGTVTTLASDGRTEISDARSDIDARSSDGDVTVFGSLTPVALQIRTSDGRQTVEGRTDPTSSTHVLIHTSGGHASYLGPRG